MQNLVQEHKEATRYQETTVGKAVVNYFTLQKVWCFEERFASTLYSRVMNTTLHIFIQRRKMKMSKRNLILFTDSCKVNQNVEKTVGRFNRQLVFYFPFISDVGAFLTFLVGS